VTKKATEVPLVAGFPAELKDPSEFMTTAGPLPDDSKEKIPGSDGVTGTVTGADMAPS
jgi:hypothetical protein